MKEKLSENDINGMNKNTLHFHLRKYGAKGVSALKISDLRDRLKKLVKREHDFPSQEKLDLNARFQDILKKRSIFENSNLLWSTTSASNLIPKAFCLEKVNEFLTSDLLLFGDEEIDAGTEKPAIKGRRMYLSEKTQFWECCKSDDNVLFRANIGASMVAECR